MSKIHKIHIKGIKPATIQSAWRKVGLIPFNPDLVFSKIKELEPQNKRPVTPQNIQNAGFIQSSPLHRTPMTLAQFAKGSKYLQETLDIERERKKIERLFQGVQVSLITGFEAINQVETAA